MGMGIPCCLQAKWEYASRLAWLLRRALQDAVELESASRKFSGSFKAHGAGPAGDREDADAVGPDTHQIAIHEY